MLDDNITMEDLLDDELYTNEEGFVPNKTMNSKNLRYNIRRSLPKLKLEKKKPITRYKDKRLDDKYVARDKKENMMSSGSTLSTASQEAYVEGYNQAIDDVMEELNECGYFDENE